MTEPGVGGWAGPAKVNPPQADLAWCWKLRARGRGQESRCHADTYARTNHRVPGYPVVV